jgi:hypothetical protein
MSDIQYLNISIGNDDPNEQGNAYYWDTTKASLTANFTEPILTNPTEWYGSIIRFSVPLGDLPVATFYCQSNPVINPLLGIDSFTIRYNTFTSVQSFTVYVPEDLTKPTPQPSSISGNPLQDFSTGFYEINSYTQLIDLWNAAIKVATTSINTLAGTTFTAPFFFYNSDTQKIALYSLYSDGWQNVGGPKLYSNYQMIQYFRGISITVVSKTGITSPNGLDFFYNISDNKLNQVQLPITTGTPTATYLKSDLNFQTYCYYSLLKSIIITSSNSIKSEYTFVNPYFSNTTINNIKTYGNNQNLSSTPILQDFLPDLTTSSGANQQTFIYNASSLYRMFEFLQSSPLYSLNLTISYTDVYNNVIPLTLNKNVACNIKFMFVKKSFYSIKNLLK